MSGINQGSAVYQLLSNRVSVGPWKPHLLQVCERFFLAELDAQEARAFLKDHGALYFGEDQWAAVERMGQRTAGFRSETQGTWENHTLMNKESIHHGAMMLLEIEPKFDLFCGSL